MGSQLQAYSLTRGYLRRDRKENSMLFSRAEEKKANYRYVLTW